MLLITILIVNIGCEADDELSIDQLQKFESSNKKIDTSDLSNKSQLENKAVGDTIPDIDVIHWNH